MTDSTNDWKQVTEDLNGLALKLRLHFDQAAGDEAEAARAAVNGLRETIDRAFDALGRAAKDPAVREDVQRVGASLGEAIAKTFADVGAELSKAFSRKTD